MSPGVRTCRQEILLIAVCAALGTQAACVASAPPLPTAEARDRLGVVAIVPARYAPDSEFVTFAKGKVEGAAKGAALGGGTSAVAFGALLAGTSGIGAAIVAITGVFVTAAAIVEGGVEGANAAIPAGRAREVDAVIDAAVAQLDAQRSLGRQIDALLAAEPWIKRASAGIDGPAAADDTPDYAGLRGTGVDTVLEIGVISIGIESCAPEFIRRMSTACAHDPKQPRVDLFMQARARLVRVADGEALFVRTFRFKTPRRPVAPWIAQDGRLLAEEIARGYAELAERIRDEAFLITPLPLPMTRDFHGMPGPGHPGAGVCGLAPLEPAPAAVRVSEMWTQPVARDEDLCPAAGQHFGKVRALRPTLRWSAFPRDEDRAGLDPDVLRRIGGVSYELRIWAVEACERGAVVYERVGLPAPEHALETPLEPATRYFWSVRARFSLDARPMATRWSHFDPMVCAPDNVRDWEHHRFTTPP